MIDLSHLKGERWGVFGLGRTGLAAVKALVAGGVAVVAWDDTTKLHRAAEDAGAAIEDLATRDLSDLAGIVWSPGAVFLAPKPLAAASAARRAGVPLVSDVQLLLDAVKHATIVGITGSNGKSTTTALLGHILATAGRAVAVGGNLGPPTLGLEMLDADGVYVLELSSYQLELTPRPRFDIALCLNLEPDHLERHGGLHAYAAQKRRIFKGPGEAIVGVDDAHGLWLADRLEERQKNRRRVTPISAIGQTASGVHADAGALYDALDVADLSKSAGQPVFEFADAAALGGQHNRQNAAAAFAAARRIGLSADAIRPALKSFPGLPHRQERIRTIGCVDYVNDSKATNAAAAARALASFPRMFWIAGGLPKDGGLAGIEPWLDQIEAAYLIGEAGAAFAAQLKAMAPGLKTSIDGDLATAIAHAHADAQSAPSAEAAPVVLLSPACASFDQFPSYEARGDRFRDLVNGLNGQSATGAAA